MILSPDTKERITRLVEESKNFYMMNREQIFLFLAEVAAVSDDLANTSYDIDVKIGEVKTGVVEQHAAEKVTASMMECYFKISTADLSAEKEWIKNQLALLNGLRIAALSAQRSTE